jgi:PAS domain S-box-containing protein
LKNLKETQYDAAALRADKAGVVRTSTFIGTALLNLVFLGWVASRISKALDQREAAVLQSERQTELLSTTLASIGDGVIVTDPKGCITFLNPEAERLTGWRASEAFGAPIRTVFRVINEDSRQPVENPGEHALRMGTVVGLADRALLIAKDGRETPIDDSGAPVRRHDGPVLGVVLVFRDISEQRKGQEARERLAAIVESSEDAVFSNTLQGVIRTWNVGAQRMFGYTPEEIIGKSSSLLLPSERAREEQEYLKRLTGGGRMAALETVRLTRDGRSFDASVTISALKSDDDRIVGVSQIVRDITERRRAQLELQHMNAELEKRVVERTRSLQEATDQLNAFCYSVAHDLQAPLRAQLAFAQVVLEDFGPAIGQVGREYMHRIAQSADRQGRLVRDLLAHVSLSRTDLPLEPVDLAKAVQKVRMDLSADIESQQAALRLGPLLGNVLANPASLHLVISNLVSNALKFVAPGTQPDVRIWSEMRNGSVRLWVEDKGIGIPAKHIGKLFGVFQRLHTVDEYPGTGIGLAIVKKAAERMSGVVGVESDPGVGSKFWVELRAAAAVSGKQQEESVEHGVEAGTH